MKKLLVVLSLFLFFILQIKAQEEVAVTMPRFRLGIEAGTNLFIGKDNKPAMIRENQSSYYYDYYDNEYYCGFVPDGQTASIFYLGVKPEYTVNRKLVVALGTRFSVSHSVIKSDKSYYLWKISEDETNTNYVKINKISQINYYVGIPMEIKIFPREIDYFVRHYFVLGTTLMILAVSNNDVLFENSAMKKYTSEILEHIGKPKNFHGQVYTGFGLKIGKSHNPFGSFEFHFPVFMIEDGKPNPFVNTEDRIGCGFKTTLQIPLIRKHQLSYKVIHY